VLTYIEDITNLAPSFLPKLVANRQKLVQGPREPPTSLQGDVKKSIKE